MQLGEGGGAYANLFEGKHQIFLKIVTEKTNLLFQEEKGKKKKKKKKGDDDEDLGKKLTFCISWILGLDKKKK